ncbi:hypothetical protein CBM2587_A160121 [Cupriavidus taiwanensis]|uniref:Uncharacterized protein n=1 Tax=Cupriavidus taiwanensis TaxID=164546 RepID=A0A975WVG0_9BURK|nr:hypothetical protein CBM2587_A160121 [Cupriavidus taiwanensis]
MATLWRFESSPGHHVSRKGLRMQAFFHICPGRKALERFS